MSVITSFKMAFSRGRCVLFTFGRRIANDTNNMGMHPQHAYLRMQYLHSGWHSFMPREANSTEKRIELTVSVRILGLIRLSAKQSVSVASRYTETDSGERYERAHSQKPIAPRLHTLSSHTLCEEECCPAACHAELVLVAREQCKSHAAVAALTEIHHIALRLVPLLLLLVVLMLLLLCLEPPSMLTHQMIVSRVRISVNHAHVLSGFPLHYFARCEYVRADEHVLLSLPTHRYNGSGAWHTDIGRSRSFSLGWCALFDCLEAGTSVFALVWCDYPANWLILLSRLWC